MKLVPEVILQRYIQDQFEQFQSTFVKLFDSRISHVRRNKPEDAFPDLYFVLEDKREIPVEVEWKTSNFDHADNPEFTNFVKQNGMVIVAIEEKNITLGSIKQLTVSLDKFEKWFVDKRNVGRIVKESLKPLREMEKKQRSPKLWLTLLTKKGGALGHFEPALIHQTWGIQNNYKVNSETHLEGIQEGDMIAFLAGLHGSFKSKNTGTKVAGRYPLPEWIKKSFNGYFEYICVFKVTRGYFHDNSTKSKIWETSPNSKWKNELFPHRFEFDRDPLFIMEDLKVNSLALTTKKELHSIVYSNIGMCEPFTLVDILHNAKQVKTKEHDKVLEEIPQS
jgi:hypothetical protein